MLTPDAVIRARELLAKGFPISALNLLVEDARQGAVRVLSRLRTAQMTPDAMRVTLTEGLTGAIDGIIARLQVSKEEVQKSDPPPARKRGRPRQGK